MTMHLREKGLVQNGSLDEGMLVLNKFYNLSERNRPG